MSLPTSKNKNLFHRFDGVFWGNPVLALGLGVSFAVVPTTSMKNAAVLAAAMFCTSVPVFLIASFLAKYIPQWMRAVVYCLISALILIPLRILLAPLSPAVFDSLGVYFSLMALNPAVLIPALSHRVTGEKPSFALLNALCYSAGFSLVLFGISLVREPLGSGTLWGHPLGLSFQLSPIQYSFGGFILLGYFAAAYQLLERAFILLAKKRAKASQKYRPVSGSRSEEPAADKKTKKEKLAQSEKAEKDESVGQTGHNVSDRTSNSQLQK